MQKAFSLRTRAKTAAAVLLLLALAVWGAVLALPQQALGATPVSIEVTLVDQETGEPLTAEQIGDGVDAVCYAFPYFEVMGPVKPYLGPDTMEQYATPVHFTQPTATVNLNLNPEASIASPYFIGVSTQDNPTFNPYSSLAVLFDGTNIYPMVPSPLRTATIDDDAHISAVLPLVPAEEVVKVNPTVPVTISSSDPDAYPVYLWANLNSSDGPIYSAPEGDPNACVVKITGDGEYALNFPQAVSAGSLYHHSLSFDFYSDEACTVRDLSWSETNLSSPTNHYDNYNLSFYQLSGLEVSQDGSLSLDSGATKVELAVQHETGLVPATMNIFVEDVDESCFPVRARLNFTYNPSDNTKRRVASFYDVVLDHPGEYPVTTPFKMQPGGDYSFSVSFYRDGSINEALDWYAELSFPGYNQRPNLYGCSLEADGSLKFGSNTVGLTVRHDSNYYAPHFMVKVDSKGVGKFPVYLNADLSYGDPHGSLSTSSSTSIEITEDGIYDVVFNREFRGWTAGEIGAPQTAMTSTLRYRLSSEGTGSYVISLKGPRSWNVGNGELETYITADNGALVSADATSEPLVIELTANPVATEWNRLWGSNALGTMADIAQEGWEHSDTVIIATFRGYHDALAAAPLAGVYQAPILLTKPTELSEQAQSEIERLGATRAIIVGGPAAVSDDVKGEIEDMGLSVERAWGSNARMTAVDVASKVNEFDSQSYSPLGPACIIATSKSYHDALAIAPYAYSHQVPIFLTKRDGSLDEDVLTAIKQGGYAQAIIVGGKAVVPTATREQIEATGMSVTRLWGSNALVTANNIAQWCIFFYGMNPDNMGVATSGGYHDALAGAALCGHRGSVLVLVNKDGSNLYGVDNFVTDNADGIFHGYVFGGEKAVVPSVAEALEAATA